MWYTELRTGTYEEQRRQTRAVFLSGSGFYAHNVKCIKYVQILAVAKQSLCGHSSASSFRQSTGFETAVSLAVARKSAEYPQ